MSKSKAIEQEDSEVNSEEIAEQAYMGNAIATTITGFFLSFLGYSGIAVWLFGASTVLLWLLLIHEKW